MSCNLPRRWVYDFLVLTLLHDTFNVEERAVSVGGCLVLRSLPVETERKPCEETEENDTSDRKPDDDCCVEVSC